LKEKQGHGKKNKDMERKIRTLKDMEGKIRTLKDIEGKIRTEEGQKKDLGRKLRT
jgi:hypothetical protein